MSTGKVHQLSSVLPCFELGWRWRCRRDRDGEGDGDGRRAGEEDREGERDEGRRSYLKEDGVIEITNVPCVISRVCRIHNFFLFASKQI
jgi:hypothetical protein